MSWLSNLFSMLSGIFSFFDKLTDRVNSPTAIKNKEAKNEVAYTDEIEKAVEKAHKTGDLDEIRKHVAE